MKYDLKNKSNIMTLVAYACTLLALVFVWFDIYESGNFSASFGDCMDSEVAGAGLWGASIIITMISALVLVAFLVVEMLDVKPLAFLKKWMFIPACVIALFVVLGFIGGAVFVGDLDAGGMTFANVLYFILVLGAAVFAGLKYFLFDKTHKAFCKKVEQK